MTSPASSSQADPGVLFECRDLSVSMDNRQILKVDTLDLMSGQVTGLIGHNGSGKSTLLKLLAGQLSASDGQVSFAGTPLKAWDRRKLARKIAYLPQETPPTKGLLVRELVALGRYPWHGPFGRFSDEDRQKTEEAMRQTDISRLADRLAGALSGGERQRAWIAMMVAQDPRCLLLDEPISALDVSHQIEVLDLVRSLCQTRNLSAIVVLHDINMAARYCDRLIALKGGKCIADGAPQSLLTEKTLHEIYGVSMNVMPHPGRGGILAYVN